MRFLWKYLKNCRWMILFGMGLKLAGTLVELLIPYVMEHLLDHVVPRKETLPVLLWGGVMILLACLYIYPVFLMANNSLKPFKEILTDVLALPSKIAWDNYGYVIEKMEYFRLFWNNVVITIIGIVGIVVFSAMAAYILDRRKTKLTKPIHTFIITPMLIPFQTIMITLLKAMNIIHLDQSRIGLGVQYWGFGIPMATFIFYNFITFINIRC